MDNYMKMHRIYEKTKNRYEDTRKFEGTDMKIQGRDMTIQGTDTCMKIQVTDMKIQGRHTKIKRRDTKILGGAVNIKKKKYEDKLTQTWVDVPHFASLSRPPRTAAADANTTSSGQPSMKIC